MTKKENIRSEILNVMREIALFRFLEIVLRFVVYMKWEDVLKNIKKRRFKIKTIIKECLVPFTAYLSFILYLFWLA